jgi:hypothetical protein
VCQLIAVTSGRCLLVGTPETIAGEMERWFAGSGCDGFSIMAPSMHGGLTGFLDRVVPVLRRRGPFHEDHEGGTPRENLGLPRPRNAAPAPRTPPKEERHEPTEEFGRGEHL